ncbi:MAG TPA: RNA polymerase subunit sigma-24, partial [Cytophagales bacterium]|nr:RNA polymerase subunit sigma-24 [Cytophagales bacterium]
MKRSQTPHEQATDEVLMTRIAKRDKQAFDVLYNRYHKRLYGYLYRMCWQNQVIAEDLLQETFIRVFKAAKDFDPSRKFVTWLFSIGSNLVKNEYRRHARR